MNGTRISAYLLTLIWLSIASCTDPYSASIENINFREDGEGFRRFYADIPGYYDRGFYHFVYESKQIPMVAVRCEVKKLSGFSDVGYGIVFCLQDDGDYYRLLIKTNGTYSITRKAGGIKVPILDWTANAYLEQGYDVLNEILVTYDYPTKLFIVSFNGFPVVSFVDSAFPGGYSGFYAIIGPEEMEMFPDEPVDIRFRQILPIPDPR